MTSPTTDLQINHNNPDTSSSNGDDVLGMEFVVGSPTSHELSSTSAHHDPSNNPRITRRSRRQDKGRRRSTSINHEPPPPPVADQFSPDFFDESLTDYFDEFWRTWQERQAVDRPSSFSNFQPPLLSSHLYPPPSSTTVAATAPPPVSTFSDHPNNSNAAQQEFVHQVLTGVPSSNHLPTEHQPNSDTTTIQIFGLELPNVAGKTIDFSFGQQLVLMGSRIHKTDLVLCKLHHLCDKAGAPRYLADSIIKLLREETQKNQFNLHDATITQRQSLISRLQKQLGTPPPQPITITLESGLTTVVFRFDYVNQLQKHLLSRTYADSSNLSHQQSHIGYEILPKHDFSNLTNGDWYRNAIEKYKVKLDTGLYHLHPLIGYVDKTGIGLVEKNSLEPVAISSLGLTQSARENDENWIVLGYIPNLKCLRKKMSPTTTTSSRSISQRDYHHCLSILLEPLKKLQQEQPKMLFRRNDTIGSYHIIPPLVGMIGDNLSNDVLAQRVSNYTETSVRMSRRCLCPFDDCDNPIHICHNVSELMIRKLSMGALGPIYGRQDTEVVPPTQLQNVISESTNYPHWEEYLRSCPTNELRTWAKALLIRRMKICDAILHKVLGTHALINAFNGVDFGPTVDGIHRATLTDGMHTIDEGLVPRILEIFYGMMSDSKLSEIDQYVESTFGTGNNRNGEKEFYPRVAFRQGYTKLTNLSASERIGQLYVLSIILQTEKGQALLAHRFDPEFDSQRAKLRERLAKRLRKDKARTQPVDIEEEDSEEDTPIEPEEVEEDGTTTTNQEVMEWEDIKSYLTSIQLEYVHKHLHPSLPPRYQEILISTLKKLLKPIHNLQVLDLQDFVNIPLPDLDYQYTIIAENCQPVQPTELQDWLPTKDDIQQYRNNRGSKGRPLSTEKKRQSVGLDIHEFTYLVETILSFHQAVKDPHFLSDTKGLADSVDHTQERVNGQLFAFAVSTFIDVLVNGIDRGKDSKGWKLRKTVELSHFLPDLAQFGSADGFNSNTGERMLKVWAKQPSRTAQNASSIVHSKQTSLRMHETSLLKEALMMDQHFSYATNEKLDPKERVLPTTGEKFKLDPNTGTFTKEVGTYTREVSCLPLSPTVVEWFMERNKEMETPNQNPIAIYSEWTISGDKIRAHANYRGGGPWYEYVLLRDSNEDKEGGGDLPCRLAAIFYDESESQLKVVLQVATSQDRKCIQRSQCSMLYQHWSLEHIETEVEHGGKYHRAIFNEFPIEDIIGRICCLDICANIPGDPYSRRVSSDEQQSFLILHTNRSHWAELFLGSPWFYKTMCEVPSTKKKKTAKKRKRS